MMLTPYPTDFPSYALGLLVDRVKGGDIPAPVLVHACWNVAGYALAQTLGGGPLITADPVADNLQTAGDLPVREAAIEQEPSLAQAVQGLFPWSLVLSIALRILSKQLGL